MGSGQSKPDDNVFYSETPIEFSEDVVNHLADNMASPGPNAQRQSSIDAHVRSRIQAELSRLRKEEELVQLEIEKALEKENLDKENAMAGEAAESSGEVGSVKSSAALLGDLEEVRQKVERYHKRKDITEGDIQEKSEAVASCYRSHPTTPLECWRDVLAFKASVAKVEQQYVDSLR